MNRLIAGFTGTQRGMTQRQLHAFGVQLYGCRILHHGDCIGADAQAYEIARQMNMHIVAHPRINPIKRAWTKSDVIRHPYDYRTRNTQIVNECDILFAAPFDIEKSQPYSGTWMTVRIARRAMKPILIVWSNGRVTGENDAKIIENRG